MKGRPTIKIILIIVIIQISLGIQLIYSPVNSNILEIKISKPVTPKTIKMASNEKGMNLLLKICDKNGNKIHDQLERMLQHGSSDLIDVIVITSDLNEKVIDFFNKYGMVEKVYERAITGFSGKILGNWIYELAEFQDVVFIQPIFRHKKTTFMSTKAINVRSYVWDTLGYNGSGDFAIAIIDSGIDPTHPMTGPYYGDANFSGKIVGWYDAVNGSTMPYDDDGHGTTIASLAAGNEFDGLLDGSGRTTIRFVDLGWRFVNYGASTSDDIEDYYLEEVVGSTENGKILVKIYWQDNSTQGSGTNHYGRVTGVKVYDSLGNPVAINTTIANPVIVEFTANAFEPYFVRIPLLFHFDGDDPAVNDGPGVVVWGYANLILSHSDSHKRFSGIAPGAKLVGVKVLDRSGYGDTDDILNGFEWIIANRDKYHIAVATITFGSSYVDLATEIGVQNLVNHGIIPVVSAGNDGHDKNTINSPGNVDDVISVGASNTGWFDDLNVTDWSSRGPYSIYDNETIAQRNTSKPDVVAPGGDFSEPSLICADLNDNDDTDIYVLDYNLWALLGIFRSDVTEDIFSNDSVVSRGTSMSAGVAGGAVNLLVEALSNESWSNWNPSRENILRVKQILLLTAWEIYRAQENAYTIDRGSKDVIEGYGLIQLDAAIEAVKNTISVGDEVTAYLTNTTFGKHVWASKVYLQAGTGYILEMDVPENADFDVFVWDQDPNTWGEPLLIGRSIKTGNADEGVAFSVDEDGYYYITVKAVEGSGNFNLTIYVDTQVPVLSVISPVNDTTYPPYPNLVLNVSIEDELPEEVLVKVYDNDELIMAEKGLYHILPVFSPGEHTLKVMAVDAANHTDTVIVVFTVLPEEVLTFKVNPSSGSVVEKKLITISVDVEVRYSYVSSVKLEYDDSISEFTKVYEENNESIWELDFNVAHGLKGKIIVSTPVQDFEYNYSLSYNPYFTVTIVGVGFATVVVVGGGGYYLYKKRREERLKRLELESQRLAEETLEEIAEGEEEEK